MITIFTTICTCATTNKLPSGNIGHNVWDKIISSSLLSTIWCKMCCGGNNPECLCRILSVVMSHMYHRYQFLLMRSFCVHRRCTGCGCNICPCTHSFYLFIHILKSCVTEICIYIWRFHWLYPSTPGDTFILQRVRPASVQIMDCSMFSAHPITESRLGHC